MPQGNPIDGIWGTADNDVWVTGAFGTTMHYDGTSWTRYPSGHSAPGRLPSQVMWGSAANNLFAAHDDGVWRWNGTAWTVSTTGRAYAVGGTAATDVWAFFLGPSAAKQFNGTSWVDRPLPTTGWRTLAVGGSTVGRPIAVSATGAVARWTGSAWALAPNSAGTLVAAVILDDTHIVATTETGVIFWNGTSWGGPPTAPASPLPAGKYGAIAATSYSDVWVRGYHYDGTTWTAVPGDLNAAWVATWMPATGRVWRISATADVRAWDGSSWQAKTTHTERGVAHVWGTADDDLWIFAGRDRDAQTLHWDGSTWTDVPFPFDQGYSFHDMWGSAPDDYWLVGYKESPSRFPLYVGVHWNGTEWREAYVAGDDTVCCNMITSIWGSARDNIYAATIGGLLHYDGVSWTTISDLGTGYVDVFGTAANDVYALKDSAEYRHWNGVTWESHVLPSRAQRGWANSATDVWFAGAGITQFDGSFYTPYATGIIHGLPVGTATDMYAATQGSMWHWDNGTSTAPTEAPLPFGAPYGGWRSPSGRVYITTGGLLVHEP